MWKTLSFHSLIRKNKLSHVTVLISLPWAWMDVTLKSEHQAPVHHHLCFSDSVSHRVALLWQNCYWKIQLPPLQPGEIFLFGDFNNFLRTELSFSVFVFHCGSVFMSWLESLAYIFISEVEDCEASFRKFWAGIGRTGFPDISRNASDTAMKEGKENK